MKMSKIFMLLAVFSLVAWSCNNRSAETENAYAEVVNQTDSIQQMNRMLKDTLQMVMNLNMEMRNAQTPDIQDSSGMEEVARYEVVLKEKQAALNKIDEQASNFETFERDYDAGDLEEADIKAKIDEVEKQQSDIMSKQKDIKRELERIHRTQSDMRTRWDNDMMTDHGELTDDEAKDISKSRKDKM